MMIFFCTSFGGAFFWLEVIHLGVTQGHEKGGDKPVGRLGARGWLVRRVGMAGILTKMASETANVYPKSLTSLGEKVIPHGTWKNHHLSAWHCVQHGKHCMINLIICA